jgi:hypothetical protein
MYVCMHVCIYVYIYIHTHIHASMYVHIKQQQAPYCMDANMCVYVYECVHVHACMYIHIHAGMYVPVKKHQTSSFTCTHTHTHTYIQTQQEIHRGLCLLAPKTYAYWRQNIYSHTKRLYIHTLDIHLKKRGESTGVLYLLRCHHIQDTHTHIYHMYDYLLKT